MALLSGFLCQDDSLVKYLAAHRSMARVPNRGWGCFPSGSTSQKNGVTTSTKESIFQWSAFVFGVQA